jgi:nucleoside-triphosphatase THEP1
VQKSTERAPIYAIRRDDPEGADRVVGDLVDLARSAGIEVAGVTQKNIHRVDRIHNDMHLVSLCSSEEYRISEDRGAMASGCRLDRDLIARAAVDVERVLMSGTPRLLVINKFGKAEEEGGGMRNAIALAIEAGIPVLMTVGRLSMGSLLDFAGPLVEVTEPDRRAVKDWLRHWCPQLGQSDHQSYSVGLSHHPLQGRMS